MGWNLLRRTALILLPAAGFYISPGFADSVPAVPEGTIGSSKLPYTAPYLPARQNHAAPKAWSIDFNTLIESRQEFTYWLEQWTSAEGVGKLEVSLNRVFEFRTAVDTIIRESGLPWELSAIPIVESNWRIDAVSSSGAAGPWQFMESSARGRNLIIDAWRDERRDVWRSTEAAMQELAFYHRLFSDWLLAIASYNAGPTRIRRLRDETGLNTYWELLDEDVLPSETRNYVPQVIAVAYITAHSGRIGLPIRWGIPTSWVRIPLDRSIHIGKLMEATGLDTESAGLAYTELHHPVTPPPSLPYYLKVPKEYAEKTVQWLTALEKENSPERFWRYTVKSGDTLSGVADDIGISLSELLSYNDHVLNRVLRIGEKLYLPGNEIKPEAADKDDLPQWSGRYRVKPGDSFWSIARSYGIRPERLAEANHRPLSAMLMTGSMLHVPAEEEEL